MKAYRLLALVVAITLILSLTSCDQLHFHTGNGGYKDPHDQYQNGLQGGTQNGTQNGTQSGSQNINKDDENGSEGGEGNVTYVYSVITKVLHLPGCYHIDRIKEEYKFEFTGDINEMFAKDFKPCKDCLVPDEPEEEPEEEDDPNKIAKEDATYLINASSGVVHELDCYHIEGMAEKNIEYTDLELDELIALEHRPCATCFPEEAEEWEKNHPDKK